MEDDINYWLKYRHRLVDTLFKDYLYGPRDDAVPGVFWGFVVRNMNNRVACGCAWCKRIHLENEWVVPIVECEDSLYCRLTCAINELLEKNGCASLEPYSGCILDPQEDGIFMEYDETMLSKYVGDKNINNKKNFNIFMNKVENEYIKSFQKIIEIKELETNVNCPICLEEICEDGGKLICTHIFHRACIWKWFEFERNCPICRTDFMRESGNLFANWLISQIDFEKNNIDNN